MITRKPPLSLFQSVLHLAVLGTVGWAVLGILLGLIGAGIGLAFVLGIGLVLLVGAVYALFGLGWFETARVNGLYRLDVPLPALRRRTTAGFGGWLRSLGAQLADGPMWRGLANLALGCLLGVLLVPLVRMAVSGVALLFAPLGAAPVRRVLGFEIAAAAGPLWGVLAVVVALAASLALAPLHRTLSLAILASRAREVPWWLWGSGVMGAVIVIVIAWLILRLGAGATNVLMLAGQVIGSESNQGNTVDWWGRSCRGRDCGYHTHLNIFDKRIGSNVNPLGLIE